jgi:lysophospholipase L1-like esterase
MKTKLQGEIAMKKIKFLFAFIILSVLGMCYAGYSFAWGPFGFLDRVRLANIPGNADEYNMDSVEPLENSPLEGKKVLFLGSSVTFGSASLQQGIPEYFGVRFDCEYTKEAVSGTTLVDNGESSYVQRILNNVDKNEHYDLVICQLSTNDATRGLPLGEISPSKELSSFDTSTIIGAIEYIICYAKETWGCDVMFYTGSRYESDAYSKMVESIFDIKEKWGIGVIDLWSGDDFNSISDSNRAFYMNDDIHPTKAGYRDWWCPEMERQILDFYFEK